MIHEDNSRILPLSQLRILNSLTFEWKSTKEISKKVGTSVNRTRRLIKILREKNIIDFKDVWKKRNTPYYKYKKKGTV